MVWFLIMFLIGESTLESFSSVKIVVMVRRIYLRLEAGGFPLYWDHTSLEVNAWGGLVQDILVLDLVGQFPTREEQQGSLGRA